jgi:hypothetical protein
MPQDKEPAPGKKAGATRTTNKAYRVVLDAIAESEERLAAVIAKSEAGIHGELASIRQELREIDSSIKFLAERLLSGSERAALKRAVG